MNRKAVFEWDELEPLTSIYVLVTKKASVIA